MMYVFDQISILAHQIKYRFEINYCRHLSMPSRKSEINQNHAAKEADIFKFTLPSLASVRYFVSQLPVEVFHTKIIHSAQWEHPS